MKTVCLVFLATCLTACGNSPRDLWWKEGGSAEQFDQDSAWCRERAQIVGSSMPQRTFADGAARRKREKEFHHFCLKMKGYNPVEGEGDQPHSPPLAPVDAPQTEVCHPCGHIPAAQSSKPG